MRTRPGPGELLDRRPGELGERPQSSGQSNRDALSVCRKRRSALFASLLRMRWNLASTRSPAALPIGAVRWPVPGARGARGSGGPAEVGGPPPPAAPKFRFASEPAVPLRSGWSGHCLQIVERVLTTLRLRKTQDKCQSLRDRGALGGDDFRRRVKSAGSRAGRRLRPRIRMTRVRISPSLARSPYRTGSDAQVPRDLIDAVATSWRLTTSQPWRSHADWLEFRHYLPAMYLIHNSVLCSGRGS